MRTAVVILNWNTKEYLERFLPGVLASAGKADAEVIVADSASTDGSMALMAERFPSVRTIPLSENFGFTGGYNRALSALRDEGFAYYLLLNSDIEVPGDWLLPLTAWMDSHPDCGACAPKLHSWYDRDRFEYAGAAGGLLDRYGYPFCRGRVMSRVEEDEGQYDTPKDVFWVTGACLMVRSQLFHELGGLDPRFFAHMEEIDFCWRLQLAGYKVTVVPDAVVWHLGGGTLPQGSPWKLQLNYRNNLLMLENNLARTLALRLGTKKGLRRARRRIFERMVLDGMSAAVYLLTGTTAWFRAVRTAHREYRSLRHGPGLEEIKAYLKQATGVQIEGFYDHWMIPRALLAGNRIFRITRKM